MEFVPDSEYDSACEESDVDHSIFMPTEATAKMLKGTYFGV